MLRDGAYQSILLPCDALLLVGVCVRVALDGAGVAAEEAVERGADLVAAVLLDGVALGAPGLEEAGTLLSVTCVSVSTGFSWRWSSRQSFWQLSYAAR